MVTFRAHYDGRSILPDEPVDLVDGAALIVTVIRTPAGPAGKGTFMQFANSLTRVEAAEMQRVIQAEFEKIEGEW
ncbi:MAG: hypothetical protein ACLQVA_08690 [Candidatus Brocadiia bacterium]